VRQPIELMQLKDERFNPALTKDFLKNSWKYNREFAFGNLVLDRVSYRLIIISKD
jgi:hypothetical protein